MGAVDGLIGILVGTAITATVSVIGIPLPPPGSCDGWLSQPSIVFSAVAFAFGLSVVTPVISAALPASKASRLEVADALRKVN